MQFVSREVHLSPSSPSLPPMSPNKQVIDDLHLTCFCVILI